MRDYLVRHLEAHIEAFDKPFAWGTNDCATFCAKWVEKVTGFNPLHGWPEWNDAMGAIRSIRTMGYDTLADVVTDSLKPLPSASNARVGDVVAREGDDLAIGICIGPRVAFLADHGLAYLGLAKCSRAWGVG